MRMIDPDRAAAGLYSFMVAASGNTSDLSAVCSELFAKERSNSSRTEGRGPITAKVANARSKRMRTSSRLNKTNG